MTKLIKLSKSTEKDRPRWSIRTTNSGDALWLDLENKNDKKLLNKYKSHLSDLLLRIFKVNLYFYGRVYYPSLIRQKLEHFEML